MDSKTLIHHIQDWLHLKSAAHVEGLAEPPLPAEIFSADQMERYGITLALSHQLTKQSAQDLLLNRLAASEASLLQSYDILSEQNTVHDSFSPAREWLLDNFYLIQEQIYSIRRHLPKGYGRALPQLAGHVLGYPRVYDIALQIIEHGDGRWDLENLERFITAYQGVTALTLGELWAIPITLGVALIENLSSASKRVVLDRHDRHLADRWVDRMQEVAVATPKELVLVVADMARSNPPTSSAFIAELARRLQGAALSLPLTWVEQHLAEENLTIEGLVQEENKAQAATQVTISNSIASLRRITEVNWRDFVEKMSVVEAILKTDPVNLYSKMDFGTRDTYRHVIERLARMSKKSEADVAREAIQLSQANLDATLAKKPDDGEVERHGHVGFYLIDKGLLEFTQIIQVRRNWWQKIRRFYYERPLFTYLGGILLVTLLITGGLVYKAYENEVDPHWLGLFAIAIVICATQLGMTLVNLATTMLIKPIPLPRMDFTNGIPAEWRTLVVVPALLSCEADIDALVEGLEVRFLGNRDQYLHFMLLTDYNDATQQCMPDDTTLLAYAKARIEALNQQYQEHLGIFFLCHRPRLWNSGEEKWMGKERKRGKLTDLNKLLLQNEKNNFELVVGDCTILNDIKYVITLDIDTQLPRESARQLVATMVHPLNRPHYDKTKNIVTEGYGILQPRIGEILPTSGPSRYTRLCGNDFGIDPYTRTVSDVYQDLFHEGSFIGKGIYDVKLFQQVLGERFPDNRILSHDLLEGCYLRSGFLSDIPLYEKSPNTYLSDAKRRARWIRGDWQLVTWLFPRIPNSKNERVKNPLSRLSIFKLFDNLRRSLVPIALMLLLTLNWTILPTTGFWLGIILLVIIFPALINAGLELIRKPKDMLAKQHFAHIVQTLYRSAWRLIFYIACLPHEAWYTLCAISRTAWRLLVSKKHLLEWTASNQIEHQIKSSRLAWLIAMWPGPAAALFTAAILILNHRPSSLIYTFPLLFIWLISPFFARWLSQPYHVREVALQEKQYRFLRSIARQTWSYFDTFINAENNWLPPDNYQEAPIDVLAKRTSPTNIGLSLLANLSAYDFGYITLKTLLTRTKNMFAAISKLERYRGHLYNWYSTETLAPLLPRYISTVDSGNLAGHLLTLRQGLLGLQQTPLLTTGYLNGIEDTLEILMKLADKTYDFSDFKKTLKAANAKFDQWMSALAISETLCTQATLINNELKTHADRTEMITWADHLLTACLSMRDEMKQFANLPYLTADSSLLDIQNNDIAKSYLDLIHELAAQAFTFSKMDVRFLYDESSHLMTIGFNVDNQQHDSGKYDLLSSEARLGIFVAIIQGQILQESWFALGRLLVSKGGQPILVSWSGSMFEYLMPLLIMPTYPYTLLDQTCRAVINAQITYGKSRSVPWGISESGYNALDTQFNYLYRAFGVPGLGLKRGLEDDLVIAPYASAMALMLAPEESCKNLQRLAQDYEALGQYGFYEAIDFTPSRLPRDAKKAIVRSYMVHHQGMSLLSLSYLLHDQPMQKRFINDPQCQAALLLLQERIPKPTDCYLQLPKLPSFDRKTQQTQASVRTFNSPQTRAPQIQLLSNGRYHVMLSQAGGGYSKWKDITVLRWRPDTTCDNWGLFTYIQDVDSHAFWSNSYQPTCGTVNHFQTVFSQAHVEFTRTDTMLDTHTEIVVSPEDDIELRRMRIHNRGKVKRTLEITSYGEIVLTTQAADQAQPGFSNLFIETKILSEQHAIIATRRPQDSTQTMPWLCHLLNVYGSQTYTLSFETDRNQFVGRARSPIAPNALLNQGPLSNTQGAVLDPIIAIRCRITLLPDELVSFDMLTGIAQTQEQCVALVEKYQDKRLANRIFGLAWTHSQVLLHQLNISEADAQLYCRLASSILYVNNARRADPQLIANNKRGQSGLWGYAISGDLPIILLRIEDIENIELARQLIQAQAYWRNKGLAVDLIILNDEHVGYRQSLQEALISLTTVSGNSEHGGNIVIRATEQLPAEDIVLLQSVARIILSDKRGTLKDQMSRRRITPPPLPLLQTTTVTPAKTNTTLAPIPDGIQFFNGYGGFSAAGDEYIIRLDQDTATPAPWANVLANPYFGTLVSESGQAYTWTENSHEFRLTPWNDDPLQDTSSEAFYIRDEETGLYWSPTPLPTRGTGDYQIRHGFGYSVFEHVETDIYSELSMFVALDAPVKFISIKLRNDSTAMRALSLTGFAAWVLGDLRSKNAMHIVTELSTEGAILAQNHYNTDFGDRTAFFAISTPHLDAFKQSVTADRMEFIGRNGSYYQPDALIRKQLSGKVGAGLDPCAAMQLQFNLSPKQTGEIVFMLGCALNKQESAALIQRFTDIAAVKTAFTNTVTYWQETLSALKIKTPDASVDLLANGWLTYQVLSSRLWGRTGYYQSGGAFGFRDQLQDVMSLTHTAPAQFRAQLLLCAAHQFEEGDVQHWWHPPLNRGVRTRCSDDYLWLPYAICEYIEATGEVAVLDEPIAFLQGRPLKPDEESYYELPIISTHKASLYEHAVRAINHGLNFGVHGLPLMGSGDWNDGMNMVGKYGKGESVWLAFFLYAVLKRFAAVASLYHDEAFAKKCEDERNKLIKNINENAWDGEWYRRAYFDDGTPLGSASNTECKIDSIAQSWSVLSEASDSTRSQQALASLYTHLVDSKNGLIKLLDPPFDHFVPNPGYIQGYVPGIRENGGQYTHAAVWAALAFAKLEDTEKAWALFNILNPIHHGNAKDAIDRYKIEPYVVAGDVYSVDPHTGRGGWSWYTGSAGWLNRLITEILLGIQIKAGDQLFLKPLLPKEWDQFRIQYRYKKTMYHIDIKRGDQASLSLDNKKLTTAFVALIDDGSVHQIDLIIH